MERVGQWWSVDGTPLDIEGRKVTLGRIPNIPYRSESPGEQCVVWEPGAPPTAVTGEGITSRRSGKAGPVNVCGFRLGQRLPSPAQRRGQFWRSPIRALPRRTTTTR